jgi:ISXO2-like transposase domain/Transposase zinc-ribbon domain
MMRIMAAEPKTLTQAITYFQDADNCLNYLAARRWRSGVICPTCGRTDAAFVPSRRYWQCKTRHPKAQFSVKTGTILEDSALGLEKWLPVMWMVANCKNGVSSWEIHRSLGVTQKTAWFMLHRIRLGMKETHGYGDPQTKLGGQGSEVEIDETFVGGLKKNMHADKKVRYEARGGASGKAIVQGILDRDARQIRAKVMPNVRRETLQTEILKQVKYGTRVYTDDAVAYEQGLQWRYIHDFVNKTETYVRGRVHVNGVENFWSLLKRGLRGTYVAVEPFHLFRYVDEQVFRYNNRATKDNPLTDADRFDLLCSQIVGKRLTYAELTAKGEEKPEAVF